MSDLLKGFENDRPPPSASTYSIPRRVVYILKRATMKFPHDVSVWLAYVDYARREGMRKVVGKALTRYVSSLDTPQRTMLIDQCSATTSNIRDTVPTPLPALPLPYSNLTH
jgi:hypothetical protein